jgi:N-dimethylarginine dimethylaminohydrolase
MADANKNGDSTFGTAAYGGEGWSQRVQTHKQDLGRIWKCCGIDSEWRALKSVLLHVPGQELMAAKDGPDSVQMLAPIDVSIAIQEHDSMAQLYESLGASVHLVNPDTPCQPNQMFCADLFAMTPQGAILARPASTVRAGEERWVARRLASLGIPILKTITGTGTFEGADLMWIDETTAMIGRGHRTNQQAIVQIEQVLAEIDINLIAVDMPFGTMHLMGLLRIVDSDLAICWPRRTPHNSVRTLQERGYHVAFPTFDDHQESYRGMNFVTVGPRRILMVQGLPKAQSFYERLGIECLTTPTQELSKAAGNVGCLTGILEREKINT